MHLEYSGQTNIFDEILEEEKQTTPVRENEACEAIMRLLNVTMIAQEPCSEWAE